MAKLGEEALEAIPEDLSNLGRARCPSSIKNAMASCLLRMTVDCS